MFYVGLDVHHKQIAMCILNSEGKVIQRQQVRTIELVLMVLRRLEGPVEVCFEASCGYGTLFELLKPVAARVLVAHPGLLRMIFRSKKKNDRVDAEKLAKLLYLGEVPAVHVPTADVRAWRELITFRRKLIEKRTRGKNGIRALLRTLRIPAPRRPGLWSQRGLQWLRDLEFTQALHALKRDLLVDEIESLNAQVQRVEQALSGFSRDNVSVQLLCTIPGIGLRTAEAFVAFVDDPHRFPNSKTIGSYFGLVPCQDQSGPQNRLGHITREGSSTVRLLLTEATWQAIRRSPTVREYFERIVDQDPNRKKIAVIATAHYLARVMWAMLKNGTLWREHVTPITTTLNTAAV